MEEFLNRRSEEVKQFFYVVDGLLLKLDGLKINCRPALGGERFLTNEQLSKLLHISRRALQDYRDRGILPFIALEGKILYRESDIERILQKNYVKAFDRS